MVDDRHAASTEDERGAHEDGISDVFRDFQRVFHGMRDAAGRLLHADLRDEGAEEVAVFR